VTLGLVFIGNYLWLNLGDVTGGSQVGRRFPDLAFRFWKEETAFIDFTTPGTWLGFELTGAAKAYVFLLLLALVSAVLAKNLQRTRTGRAFMAIRDRDIAAEVMGVADAKTKATAFALSSFYAGVCGALFGSLIGLLIPESFNLFLSVEFVAIVLIGGAGTIAGTLLGSAFVVLLPRLVSDFTLAVKDIVESGSGFLASVGDVIVSTGPDDGGLVSTLAGTTPGLNVSQLNSVIYGLLIILFLIFEPLGLYGIWLRIRNYWKGWPFTY
jgi:branched-chain amino acid transport system permease protein